MLPHDLQENAGTLESEYEELSSFEHEKYQALRLESVKKG